VQDPERFTEGFQTLAQNGAKALLDELAACEVPVCEWIVSKRLGSPHRFGQRIAWPEVAIH
jgi:hypothetical protein